MRTLYLRNVPDEVVERLERLAENAGTSVSTFAVQELTRSSRRANNAALLERLPDLGIPTGRIVEAVVAERDQR